MSKCPNCGREIGGTAGPCVQCTFEAKKKKNGFFEKFVFTKNKKSENADLISCPKCGSFKVVLADTVLYYCQDCGRIF